MDNFKQAVKNFISQHIVAEEIPENPASPVGCDACDNRKDCNEWTEESKD